MIPLTRHRRYGGLLPLYLGILALGLAILALIVDAAMLWTARSQLQLAADASSLAAVQAFSDDQLLRYSPETMKQQQQIAKQEAVRYGYVHKILSTPLEVRPEEDVVFGFTENQSGFQASAAALELHPLINSVEVNARRDRQRGNAVGFFFGRLFNLSSGDVVASATAYLDRKLVGFQPFGQQRVPVVPIALFSDPTGLDEDSWEHQIEKPRLSGQITVDNYAYSAINKKWKLGADGLPEFTLKLPLASPEDMEGVNGCPLYFGKGKLAEQTLQGLTSTDLSDFQGQLKLGWDHLIPIPAASHVSSLQQKQLQESLQSLRDKGEARIWPLYRTFAEAGGGMAICPGFVAARVAEVQIVSEGTPHLLVTLQPAMLITSTAITEPNTEQNSYISKARLLR